MTNELAIRILTGDVLGTTEQTQEAVTMAVRALSQPNATDINVGDIISRQTAIDALADMHCKSDEDGYVWIIRSDAWARIDALPSAQPEYRLDEWCTDCKEYNTEKHCCPRFNQVIRTTLNEMKSERKTGKWKEQEVHDGKFIEEWQSARCSVCGKYHTTPYLYYFDEYKFCPNCGVKMK